MPINYRKVHNFLGGTTEGASPFGSLVIIPSTGLLYGTTYDGGVNNIDQGTIYNYTPTPITSPVGTFNTVYNFNDVNSTPAFTLHGYNPQGTLLVVGNILYGTATAGGSNDTYYYDGEGTLFKYDTGTNILTTLHSFKGVNASNDGTVPRSGVIKPSNNKLYGTTANGGTSFYGTIYSYDLGTAVYSKIYNFNGAPSDGARPFGELVEDTNNLGTLYGLTREGGTNSVGTIYKITTAGVYTKMYDFVAATTGAYPEYCQLVQSGNIFYGVTTAGGANGRGTIFSYQAPNIVSPIYSFPNATDGMYPNGTLVIVNGNLYGITASGGTYNNGTIYRYNLSTSTYEVLHDFGDPAIVLDGINPSGGLTYDSTTNTFFGTAVYGGTGTVSNRNGIIYQFQDASVPSAYTACNLEIDLTNIFDVNWYLENNIVNGLTNLCFEITGATVFPPSFTITITQTYPPPTTLLVFTGVTTEGTYCFPVSSLTCYDWSVLDNDTQCFSTGHTCVPDFTFTCDTVTYTNPSCLGCNGSVYVFVDGGYGPYIYNLVSANTVITSPSVGLQSYNFTGVCEGTWVVTILDVGSNISITCDTITLANNFDVQITSTGSCTNAGVYCITVDGGIPPYYAQLIGSGDSANVYFIEISGTGTYCYSAQCGTYENIEIYDSSTPPCYIYTSITIPCPVTLTATTVGNPCGQLGQGIITVLNIGGTPPFQYSINGGITFQSSNQFTGLNSGAYNVLIKDAVPCTASIQVTVSNTTNLDVVAVSTPENCDYSSGGTITVTVNNGTPPYQYSLNGGNSVFSNYFTGLTVGTYTINVSDALKCIGTVTINIDPPISLSGTISTSESCIYDPSLYRYYAIKVESLIGYLGNDALENQHINYVVAQGYNIFQSYGVSTIWRTLSNTTLSPQGLTRTQAEARLEIFLGKVYSAGLFPVALMGDRNDFDWIASVDLTHTNKFWGIGLENEFWNDPNPIAAFGPWISDIQYLRNKVDTAQFPPYFIMAYLANPGGNRWFATEANAIVQAGIDVIEITNYTNNGNPPINSPNPSSFSFVNQLNLLSTAAFNNNKNQKFIPLWSGEQLPANPFSGIYFGLNGPVMNPSNIITQYDIDFAAVSYSYPANLTKAGFSVFSYNNVILSNVLPYGSGNSNSITAVTGSSVYTIFGTTLVNATGGYPPYLYSIDGGPFQLSNYFTGLNAGTHIVVVVDSSGCTVSGTTEVGGALDITANISGLNCSSLSGGILNVTVGSGIPPYLISVNGGPFTTNTQYTGLSVGSYTISAIDASGCSATTLVNITAPTGVGIIVSTTDNPCDTTGQGSITINNVGGTPQFTYSIDGGITFYNQNYFGGLNSGTYNVIIRDIYGCSATTQAVIGFLGTIDVSATTTPETCFYSSGGTITVIAQNGTAPYTYTLNGGTPTTNNYFTGLTVGTYTIDVTDSAGCVGTVIVTIDPPIVISGTSTPENCQYSSGGTISVIGTTGTPPYQYSLNGGPFTNLGYFTGLTVGSYTILVVDASGCSATTITVIDPPVKISAITTPENCLFSSAGTISVVGITGTPPYQYSLNGGAFTNIGYFTGLTVGTYNITIKDFSGCSATTAVTINPPIPVTVSASSTNIACYGGSGGTITITANGGIPPYSYSINGGLTFASNNYYTGLYLGSYNIVVKDVYGCSATTNVSIFSATPITVSATSVTAATCSGLSSVSLTLLGQGGTPPYTYRWQPINVNLQTIQANNYVNSVGNYTYTGTVIDIFGCSATTTINFTIVSAETPTLLILSAGTLSCDNSTYVTLSAITFGTYTGGPYWSNGESNVYVITANTPGSYSYYVTNTDDCVYSSTTVIVDYPNTPPPLIGYDALLCLCSSTNVILLNNGYTYTDILWNNGSTGNSISVSSCTVTGYTFYLTAKDEYGCPVTSNTVTIRFSDLAINLFKNDAICLECGICIGGYAEIIILSGTAPYTYSWTGISNNTNVLNDAQPGHYIVTVTDGAGCSKTVQFDISGTTLTECTYEPVKDGNGNIILNPDGTISFYNPSISQPRYSTITNYSPSLECCISNSTVDLPLQYCDCQCFWRRPTCETGETRTDKIILGGNGDTGVQLISQKPNNDQTIQCQYQASFDFLFNFDCQKLYDCVQNNYSGSVLTFLSGLSAYATVEIVSGTSFVTAQTEKIWSFDFNKQPTGVYFAGQSNFCELLNQMIYSELGTNCSALTQNTFAAIWQHASFKIYDSLSGQTIKLGLILEGFNCEYNILLDNIKIEEVCVITTENLVPLGNGSTGPNGTCFGFQLEKVIDNKKSWVYNEDFYQRDWFHLKYRDTSYPDYDERLDINTKEIDLNISAARAINYDIYCYALSQDCYTSSGCSNPNLIIGGPQKDYCSLGVPYLSDLSGYTGLGRITFFDANGTITSDVNQIVNAPAGGIYWDGFDINGVNRTSYFAPITGNSGTLYICQNGNTAIFSFNAPAPPSNVGTIQLYNFNAVPPPNTPSGVRPTFVSWPTNSGYPYLQLIQPSSTVFNPGLVYLYYELTPTTPNSSGSWVSFNPASYAGSMLTFLISPLVVGQQYDIHFTIEVTDTTGIPLPPGFISSLSIGFMMGNTTNVLIGGITGVTNLGITSYDFTFTANSILANYDKFFIRLINGLTYRGYYLNVTDISISLHCNPSVINPNNFISVTSGMTYDQFLDMVQTQLIDVKDRQVISAYPLLRYMYERYLGLCGDSDSSSGNTNCATQSNQYNYSSLNNFIDLIGDYWADLIEQFVPATTIWGGGGSGGSGSGSAGATSRTYSNNIFDQPKFEYRNFSIGYCDSEYCFEGNSLLQPSYTASCYVNLNQIGFSGLSNSIKASVSSGTFSDAIKQCATQLMLPCCTTNSAACFISADFGINFIEGTLVKSATTSTITSLNSLPSSNDYLTLLYTGLYNLGYTNTYPNGALQWSKQTTTGCNDPINLVPFIKVRYSCSTGTTVANCLPTISYQPLFTNFSTTYKNPIFNITITDNGTKMYGVGDYNSGQFNNGFIWQYSITTGAFGILKDFNLTIDGVHQPLRVLKSAVDGFLYGTTRGNNPSFFKIDPNNPTNFTVIQSFNSSSPIGLPSVLGNMIVHSNNKIYFGASYFFATSKWGIYQFDVTTQTLTPLNLFNDIFNNTFLGSIMTQDRAMAIYLTEDIYSGYIYGTTTTGGQFGYGKIFRFNPNNPLGTYFVVHNFNGTINGASSTGAIWPSGPVLRTSNTTFYGLVADERYTNVPNYGTDKNYVDGIYTFSDNPVTNPGNQVSVTKLTNFVSNSCWLGSHPNGNIIMKNDILYGICDFVGTNSAFINDSGRLFQYDINLNKLSATHSFTGNTSGALGPLNPQKGVWLEDNTYDGKIYGITFNGGINKTGGTIYRFSYSPPVYTSNTNIIIRECELSGSLVKVNLPQLQKVLITYSSDTYVSGTSINGISCTDYCANYLDNPGVEVIVEDLTSLITNPCVDAPIVEQCNIVFAYHIDNDPWFNGTVTVTYPFDPTGSISNGGAVLVTEQNAA